jgi:hypothetical protein
MFCLYYTVLQLEILLLHKSGNVVRCRTPHNKWHRYILLTVYVLPDPPECVFLNISKVQWSWCELNHNIYSVTIHIVFNITPKMQNQRNEIVRIMWDHKIGPPLPIHWPGKTHIQTIMKQNEKNVPSDWRIVWLLSHSLLLLFSWWRE